MARTLQVLQQDSLQPPLKWAGGKRWLVPEFQKLWHGNDKRRLVEPFVGGMAIALGLKPTRALLSDSNPHLINFYRWLSKGLSIEFDTAFSLEAFYGIRQEFNDLITSGKTGGMKAAGLFYYLNRTCFNGLCRFNRTGLFNTPIGDYSRPTIRTSFPEFPAILKGWEFQCKDFEDVEMEPGDFVIADPPYADGFASYGKSSFGWADQLRAIRSLSTHSGPVVITNHATDDIIRRYSDAFDHLILYESPRAISSNRKRPHAQEVMAFSNLKVPASLSGTIIC